MTPVLPLVGPVVGRRAELAELRRRLPSERLLTITGEPGSGTTTVAVAALADYARAHADAVRTVVVSDLPSADRLAPAVAAALEVPVDATDAPWEAVLPELQDRTALLLLDGCERLVDSCAALVDTLLKEAPGIRVVVTSRQLLSIPGEAVFRLGPLGLPDQVRPSAEQAAASDAVSLFLDRATEVRRSFRLTDANAPAVAAICTLLEGNALAVVLAAARASVLSPEDLLHRLQDQFRVLTKGAHDAPERHQSLAASVQVSHDLCDADEQVLWHRLSVFSGSLDLDGVEHVCSGDGLGEYDVLDLVDGLLEKGVLVRDESEPTQVRYRMPEVLRTFGAARMSPDEVRRTRERHLSWCRSLVARTHEAWFGDRQPELCRRLRAEEGNLRTALADAETDLADPAAVVDLAAGLAPFWLITGDPGEGRAWLDRALAHDLPADVRVRGVIVATWLAVFQGGESTQARERLEEARGFAGPPGPALAVLDRLDGALAAREGRYDDGEALLRRAIETAETLGDPQATATGWYLLGCCHWMGGRPDDAAEAAREARVLTSAVGETHLRARVLVLLAVAALDRGDLDEAEGRAREALRMHASLGDEDR